MAKKYNPSPKHNPIAIEEKMKREINKLSQFIDSNNKSFEKQIELLYSFAGHDIKNCLLTINSIIETSEIFDEVIIQDLKDAVKSMNVSLTQFSHMSSISCKENFYASQLIASSLALLRNSLESKNIKVCTDVPKDIILELPFHSLLHSVNNLIINAIKALEGIENKKIKILIESKEEKCCIFVRDNGSFIKEEDKKNIFKYGFSTTGGSGIGLFQMKYQIEAIKGKITVNTDIIEDYTKTFIIEVPLK